MKILVATANYKGSISPESAAESIRAGLLDADKNVEVEMLPLSDGGEGFTKSLVAATKGSIISLEVFDPLMRPINGYYGLIDDNVAVVEMALASGLELLTDSERDPWKATTYGTGQLIDHAIRSGCKDIIVGLGGSATNDGGVGAIQALGGVILDKQHVAIKPGAHTLKDIDTFDLSYLNEKIKNVQFTAACDVTNPLLGQYGATAVYGPQKGADAATLEKLEAGLLHLENKVQDQLGRSNAELPGVGAAGGLGYGLVTFLGAQLKSGFDIVSKLTSLEESVKWADLVITGEGKIDHQTLQGKTIHRLARVCQKYRKKLIAVGGMVDESLAYRFEEEGVSQCYALVDYAKSVEDAINTPDKYLKQIGALIIETID